MKPALRLHPVDAHEHHVEVDGPKLGDRERADQRLRRCPDAAGQDHRLVMPGGSIEHVRHPDRVGDDREARDVGETTRQGVGGGARRKGNRHAGLDEARGGSGDRLLLRQLQGRLRGEAGLVQREGGGRRAPMNLDQQAPLVKGLEVAPDRHVRHAELPHEIRDADGPALANAPEDEVLALVREESSTPVGTRLDLVHARHDDYGLSERLLVRVHDRPCKVNRSTHICPDMSLIPLTLAGRCDQTPQEPV